jgi:hypothetical protein
VHDEQETLADPEGGGADEDRPGRAARDESSPDGGNEQSRGGGVPRVPRALVHLPGR